MIVLGGKKMKEYVCKYMILIVVVLSLNIPVMGSNLFVGKTEITESMELATMHTMQQRLSLGDKPTITDSSGGTTFFGLFVGYNGQGVRGENDANAMSNALDKDKGDQFKGWEPGNKVVCGTGNTIPLSGKINSFKDGKSPPPDPKPGDEFVFYYSGHGSNHTRADGRTDPKKEPEETTPDPKDEPDSFDNSIVVQGGHVSDDELAEWLSGFPDCVTITVILDSCYSGTFRDGAKDLKSAKNANGEPYGDDHLAILAASNNTTKQSPYHWDDSDGDGKITLDELEGPFSRIVDDENHNGKKDEGERTVVWVDEDGDGEVSPDEKYDPAGFVMIGDFSIGLMKGLETPKNCLLASSTNADRNQDGVTTSKELFEYTILYLHDEWEKDNDGDGLLNEDGVDFIDDYSLDEQFFDIDNDGDLLIDEDPAPPPSKFWPNVAPQTPETPIGPISGKTDETYSYETQTTDQDIDDVYYWFEWGDGTNSGWLGPYASGTVMAAEHAWSEKGEYLIKVKARDRCFEESEWTTLEVSMPQIHRYNPFIQAFHKVLDRFQFLQPLFLDAY